MTLFVEKHTKEGASIRIPKNHSVASPIHLPTRKKQANTVISLRNTIFLEEGASTTVIEDCFSTHENTTTHVLTEIYLQKNAKIDFIKFQNEHRTATHLSSILVHQFQDSQARLFTLTTGGLISRENITVNQYGKNAECDLLGIYCLKDPNQQCDYFLQVNHFADLSRSRMLYKGLLDNTAKAAFKGKVYVNADIKRIQANQANHTILLSKTAEMSTQPELEIYADDVQCAHGATIGQLNHDALFYLQSRGIEESVARNMLLQGFIDEVINPFQSSSLKEEIQLRVKRHVEL